MRILTCQEFLSNYDRYIFENSKEGQGDQEDPFTKKVDAMAIKAGNLAEKGIDKGANLAAKVAKGGIESGVTLAHFMRKTKRTSVVKAFVIATIVAFGFSALSGLKSDVSQKVIDEAKSEVHEVKKGETLYRIAREHDTTVETLQEMNGIEDPRKIRVGQRIVLPAKN